MRPWVAPTASGAAPPSLAAVVTGIDIAPKQTFNALPTIVTRAAFRGGRPRARSMAQEIATGAPKPASPSMRPQKQKPMRRAWTRMSPLPTAANTARTSSERPVRSVRLYSHTAMTTM